MSQNQCFVSIKSMTQRKLTFSKLSILAEIAIQEPSLDNSSPGIRLGPSCLTLGLFHLQSGPVSPSRYVYRGQNKIISIPEMIIRTQDKSPRTENLTLTLQNKISRALVKIQLYMKKEFSAWLNAGQGSQHNCTVDSEPKPRPSSTNLVSWLQSSFPLYSLFSCSVTKLHGRAYLADFKACDNEPERYFGPQADANVNF